MKKKTASILSALTALSMMSAAVSAVSEKYLNLPEDIDTSFKSYMDYRTITDRGSDQYRLQQEAFTDSDGIRRVNDDVCIAVGTAYAERCGIRFEITLDSGESFTAVAGDIKADRDTDSTNRYRPMSGGMGDMVEFIVETDKLDPYVRKTGSIGTYEKYSGNICSIRVLSDA